jgi:hypothetical protein
MSKHIILLGLILSVFQSPLVAADGSDLSAYMEVVTQRAERIVNGIELGDASENRDAVVTIIAEQYRDLHLLQEAESAALTALEDALGGVSVDTVESATRAVRGGVEAQTRDLHYAFLARLSSLLNAEQVSAVKDGMTYGVMPGTYAVYLEMLPELTPEQRQRIRAWLLEAREHAIDAGSSDEKHRVFGKYKGRINNFLSAEGYDLKAAERRMWDRKKAAKTKN